MRERFEKELEKLFEGFTIEVVDLDKTARCSHKHKDVDVSLQTLHLNGKQFSMSWLPPIENLSEKTVFEVLFEDCKKKIEEFIEENKQENG
jgi:hypothetical protein|tara:strand:+ start:460 stop:732 length:273 start_codon:yes stop_codon:yes gene_type:complete